MSKLIQSHGMIFRCRLFGQCSPNNRKTARAESARLLLYWIKGDAASRDPIYEIMFILDLDFYLC
jgi:hypothetical protein